MDFWILRLKREAHLPISASPRFCALHIQDPPIMEDPNYHSSQSLLPANESQKLVLRASDLKTEIACPASPTFFPELFLTEIWVPVISWANAYLYISAAVQEAIRPIFHVVTANYLDRHSWEKKNCLVCLQKPQLYLQLIRLFFQVKKIQSLVHVYVERTCTYQINQKDWKVKRIWN